MNEERHLPRLAQLCDNIGTIIAGQQAKEMLKTAPATEDAGVIVVLPSWVWVLPAIDVGKKGVVNGVKQPMPSRLAYSGGPVFHITDDVTTDWELSGLGNSATGTATVRFEPMQSHVEVDLDDDVTVPAAIHTALNVKQRDRVLRALVRDGETARWQLMTDFEWFTKQRLAAANTIVATEIAQHKGIPLKGVVDDITLEDLASKMLYGENGTSVIQRMIDTALDNHRFDRVDPMHFFTVGIRARAEEEVRRKIGDPKVGPKVRRVFAKTQASTIDELLVEYKRIYPKDSLAKKRALAALTAGPDVSTTQRMFRDEITAVPLVGADE